MQENNDIPFTLYAEKARLRLTGEPELLSAGMAGVIPVRFTFSGDWDGLEKTAVFTNGTRTVNIPESLWDDGVCPVPEEVLQTAGKTVMAGVYGANGMHLVLPTVWCVLGRVEPAADVSGDNTWSGAALRALELRIAALEESAVTEATVQGWGFTKNALTQHQSLAGLVPREAQAAKTVLQTDEVGIDESGKLWTSPSGGAVHWIHLSYYDGDYYADISPAEIYAALDAGDAQFLLIDRYGRQCPLVFPPENDLNSPAKFFTADPSGGELVIHTLGTNSVVTSVSARMPARVSDLINDSGFITRFAVTLTMNGGTIISDKTLTQIRAASTAGHLIDVMFGSAHGWAGEVSENEACLFILDTSGGGTVLTQYTVTANGVTALSKQLENQQITVTQVSGTTPSIAALSDTVYECGEVSALTISSCPVIGSFTVIFTSGAPAATMSVPGTMHMPDGFSVETNTRYEINVRNGYAVVAGWTVN